jgi:serine/threonine protein kinase/Tol biopolymer transport system component
MTLNAGTKLGAYQIQSAIGAGGMGEVYRAVDTRLNRTVAIKVLPGHLSESPEAKERFDREARAISALNHARICTLYDVGHQDGTDFLIMEYLEGESLADRLRKGALPLKETLKIGIDVCEALEAAHRNGIVHRDLKPGNIMLTPSGAKLMDFGLAKPLGVAAASSRVASAPLFTAVATAMGSSPISPLTSAGTIVGTIQYMSPEQIEGKEADARSDIFALGSVLYEMASGKRPFEGKSQISLASAILEKDPEPISTIKPMTPPALDYTVHTCLQKNPDDRFQTAHDVKLQLQWIVTSSSSTGMKAMPATVQPKRGYLAWIVAAVVALVLIGIAAFSLTRPTPWMQVTRTVINPPDKTILNLAGDTAGPPVLSPDGTMLAFTATKTDGATAIWVRPLDSLEAQPLQGSENAVFPFWSPDSRALGFFADGKLKTIDLNGSSPQIIADAPFGRGGAWGPGGVILFSPATLNPLLRVNATGGTPVQVTKIDTSQHSSHRWPFFLPDGKHFLYLAINHEPSKWNSDMLYFASLDGKENRPLFHSLSNAIYAGGYLLFASNNKLMAQPFDPNNGTLSGEAVAVASGVLGDLTTWHMDVSAFSDKLLVMGSGGAANWQLLWMDRDGKQLTTIAENLPNLQRSTLSPQGDRVAMEIDDGQADIWTLDLARGVRTRLTFGPIANQSPVWSPDGKWIAYVTDSGGHAVISRKPADGSGPEERLYSEDQLVFLNQWTHDGKYLIYARGAIGAQDLWALPLDGERKPWSLVQHGLEGQVSPDGRWLAYVSSESGASEVYVAAFRGQGKWQVSTHGGVWTEWSSDGKQLYYMEPKLSLYSVPVTESGGALQFGSPQLLMSNWSSPQFFFDVAPDGKKILLDRIAQQVGQSVTVVTNYGAELKKK